MKHEYQRYRTFLFGNIDEGEASFEEIACDTAEANRPLNGAVNPDGNVGLDEKTVSGVRSVNLPLKSAIKIVAQIFSMYPDACERSDAEALVQELADFVGNLLSQSEISGDADDWHNLVVDIARRDYYDLCCDLLEEGLRRFPGNTDLLGDYLQYGISCGRIEKCKQYYKQLAKLPKVKYTWRSFHFSMSWLTYLWESSESQKEMDKIYQQMSMLVASYREHFPQKEDSYVCTADMYELVRQQDLVEEVLCDAVFRKFPSPKCALRLADIYFEQGNYEESLAMVQRSLRDSNRVQQSVNEAYLYYLSGLARISIRNGSETRAEEGSAEKIYSDFENCLRLRPRRDMRDRIRDKVAILKRQPHEQIPEKCTKLCELLESAGLLE